MKKNMYAWIEDMLKAPKKKAIPVLSFPGMQLLNMSVLDIISDSGNQAQCMKAVADRCDSGAVLSLMDLSVEAEAFGATIKTSPDEVPTVIGQLIDTEEDAANLQVPEVGTARTGLYIEAVKKAAELITDRPILAGCIGPFSLAGRLCDMTEIMVKCYTEPEVVHTVLEKATQFIIEYIKAYREAGADGYVMAEPAAGLLSPDLNAEFSTPYVRRINDACQSEDFVSVYHNCGNTIPLIDSILENGSRVLHFGNAIKLCDILPLIPSDRVVMGNVSPADEFRGGTPESIYADTKRVMAECGAYSNFVISSGCDIPPLSSWDNIDSFFKATVEN